MSKKSVFSWQIIEFLNDLLEFFENLLDFFFGLSFFGLEFFSKCPKKATKEPSSLALSFLVPFNPFVRNFFALSGTF